MIPVNIISSIMRLSTDIGAGVLATEIVKNFTPANMGTAKRILCALGGFGIAESIRFSAHDAIERDISETKETIKQIKEAFVRADKKDLELFSRKKKNPGSKLNKEIENLVDDLNTKEIEDDITKLLIDMPGDLWRSTLSTIAKADGDEETLEAISRLTDDDIEALIRLSVSDKSFEENIKDGIKKGLENQINK